MYCKKCGKQLDYEGDICKDCEEAELYFGSTPEQPVEAPVTTETVQPVVIQQDGDRKFGFGKALASTIMGAIAYFVMCMAYGIPLGIIEVLEEASYASGGAEAASLGIAITMVFFLIGLGLCIPSLIMGISSIKCFFARKKAGYAKPVPTLVLGIIGVATSAMAILFALLALLLISALMMYI